MASPARWDEALAFVGPEAEKRPANVTAQLAVAAIEAERGQVARAAGRYAELAALARLSGDVEDELAALLRASELYLPSEPGRTRNNRSRPG